MLHGRGWKIGLSAGTLAMGNRYNMIGSWRRNPRHMIVIMEIQEDQFTVTLW